MRRTTRRRSPQGVHIASAATRERCTNPRNPRWTRSGANHTQWWLQLKGDAAAEVIPTMATPRSK